MKDKKPGWQYWLVFWAIMGVSFSTMLLLFKPFLLGYMLVFKGLTAAAVAIDSMPIYFIVGLFHAAVIGSFITLFPFIVAHKIIDYIYPNTKA